MKNLIKTIGCVLVLLGFTVLGRAATMPMLYQSVVNVADQSAKSYQQAAKTAMSQVLIRVSGESNIVKLPAIQQALGQVNHYILGYSYQQQPSSEDTDKNSSQWRLQIKFDPNTINQLLKQTKQPRWNPDRPQLMLWLVEATPAGQQIIGSDTGSPQAKAIATLAQQRGLDLLLPMLDLDDLAQIDKQDIWNLNLPVITKATQRYDTDGILMGRVYPRKDSTQQWEGDWLLSLKSLQQEWTTTGANEAQVLQQGLNQGIDAVATQAVDLNRHRQDNRLQLNVYGVHNVADYNKVQHYLQQLPTVKQLEVSAIATDYVTFSLDVKGNAQQLQRALASDHLLLPSKTTQSVSNTLTYRLAS